MITGTPSSAACVSAASRIVRAIPAPSTRNPSRPHRTFTVPGLRENQPFETASSMSWSRTFDMRVANVFLRSDSLTSSPSLNRPL